MLPSRVALSDDMNPPVEDPIPPARRAIVAQKEARPAERPLRGRVWRHIGALTCASGSLRRQPSARPEPERGTSGVANGGDGAFGSLAWPACQRFCSESHKLASPAGLGGAERIRPGSPQGI